MGMHASSAMSRVMTNSKGCISPIWRLPINRITIKSVTNIIAVLKTVSAMLTVFVRPLFLFANQLQFFVERFTILYAE